MKKFVLLMSIVLFLTSLCFGQNIITKSDFEKLVDYSNCKYVQAFIEKNDASKPYFRDYYLKKVKPEFDKVSLDSFQTILKYEKIIELLSNNTPALKLAKKFNERKLKYSEIQDSESVLIALVSPGWENVDLSNIATNIRNEILRRYSPDKSTNSIKFSESDVVRGQTIQTTSQVEELQLKLNQLQEQYEQLREDTIMFEYQRSLANLTLFFYVGIGIMIILIIVVFILVINYPSRDRILDHVLNSQRIQDKFIPKDDFQSDKIATKPKQLEPYRLSDTELLTISQLVVGLQNSYNESSQVHNIPLQEELVNSSKGSYKYLKGKTGKIFSRVENSPEDSFFKLYNEIDNYALFEFIGDEAEAIANRIFSDDVCNITSGSYQNARFVRNISPGKVMRNGDCWEVIKPCEIQLV